MPPMFQVVTDIKEMLCNAPSPSSVANWPQGLSLETNLPAAFLSLLPLLARESDRNRAALGVYTFFRTRYMFPVLAELTIVSVRHAR